MQRDILRIASPFLLAMGWCAGAVYGQSEPPRSREELARVPTQELIGMVARLEAALRAEDFRTAFSIVVPLSNAISSKALPPVQPVALDEEIRRMESALTNVGQAGAPLIRTSLAVRALKAGDLAKAKIQAETALAEVGRAQYPPGSSLVPEMLHSNHIVLGSVALRSGDMASARQALLNAGRMPPGGSAFPGPRGPDFSLAEAMLDRGESAAVLQYLALVRVWWMESAPQLDQWSAAIRGGGRPVFPKSGRGL